MLRKLLGAALAVALSCAPAAATVYNVSATADYKIIGFNPQAVDFGNVLDASAAFPAVTLLPGDSILLSATFLSEPAYRRLPYLPSGLSLFYVADDPGCGLCAGGGIFPTARVNPDNLHFYALSFNTDFSYSTTTQTITGFTSSLSFLGPVGSSLEVHSVEAFIYGVPEISTWAMLLLGTASLAAWPRRRLSAAV